MDLNYFLQWFTLLFITAYYVVILKMLILKKKRIETKDYNDALDAIRAIPNKTVEQQKAFIALRYPVEKDWLFFNYRDKVLWFKIGIQGCIYVVAYKMFAYVFTHFEWQVTWWLALLIIFGLPLLSNYILRKFGLELQNTFHNIIKR